MSQVEVAGTKTLGSRDLIDSDLFLGRLGLRDDVIAGAQKFGKTSSIDVVFENKPTHVDALTGATTWNILV